MVQKEYKTLSPKIDVVFQALFGEVGSESITKGFLEKILKTEIKSIDLDKNPVLRREFKDEKLGVLDIIAELNNKEMCNIEMQVVDKKNIIERILYYWSRLYSKGINKGEEYDKLKKTIVICIADFEITDLKDEKCHTKWQIIEEGERKKILTNKLELHIIQLPKKGNKRERDEGLLNWLNFLEKPEEVIDKMKEDKALKEAREKLKKISADEKMQRIAELRLKAIMDEKAIYAKGIDDGIERGIEQGIEQGMEQGRRQGIEEGQNLEKIEMAKKMLEEKMDIQVIVKITGLTKEEIEKL